MLHTSRTRCARTATPHAPSIELRTATHRRCWPAGGSPDDAPDDANRHVFLLASIVSFVDVIVIAIGIQMLTSQRYGIAGLLYSGTVDCLKKTIAEDGISSLYKGFVPSWLRMAPWSLVFFLSFEQLRAVAGMEAF